jgi:hypothetical protein
MAGEAICEKEVWAIRMVPNNCILVEDIVIIKPRPAALHFQRIECRNALRDDGPDPLLKENMVIRCNSNVKHLLIITYKVLIGTELEVNIQRTSLPVPPDRWKTKNENEKRLQKQRFAHTRTHLILAIRIVSFVR